MSMKHCRLSRQLLGMICVQFVCLCYLIHSVSGFTLSSTRRIVPFRKETRPRRPGIIIIDTYESSSAVAAAATTTALSATTVTNVLVVGGSGRVGGSTVRWLQKYSNRNEEFELNITVGGRSRDSFDRAKQQGVIPNNVDFIPIDWTDWNDDQLSAAILSCDTGLLVHTAGPFQGRTDPTLIRCCIQHDIPYIDVCDEFELAAKAKQDLQELAKEKGVKAVVCSGIWPGVSALMAANAVEQFTEEEPADTIDFSFFTAGTGGAGPTIVSATFLLLATPVITIHNGSKRELEPWTDTREVDFGDQVGRKPIWLLDNPDVPTTAQALGVPNASSRFGTDPLPWNYLFGAMKAIPRDILYNRNAMQNFALFSEPIIRFVDMLVGSTNAMRVDVRNKSGSKTVTQQIVHSDLEMCVGLATAAFAMEVLKKDSTIPGGVWYPAELPKEARMNILEAAREGTITYNV